MTITNNQLPMTNVGVASRHYYNAPKAHPHWYLLAIGHLSLMLFAILMFTQPALAQKKAEADENLSKGDAIMLLSASDFVKQKIGELLSWTVGYDISRVNRVKLTPTINYVKVAPRKVPPDGRTILDIYASVDDPNGLINIAGVRADLSSIGRLPNTMLVDNGLYGDEKAGDGVFSLQTTVSPKINLGSKDIPVAVANKKGWLALAKTSLEVKKNPAILDIRLQPEKLLADGRSLATITVKVDNPGRLEDINSVSIDLSQLGLEKKVSFINGGEGGVISNTWVLQTMIAGTVPSGTYPAIIRVTNLFGGYAEQPISLTVVK